MTMDPILSAAAAIPAALLLYYVWKADRLEKESPRLLASLVLCGIGATLIALALEWLGGALLDALLDSRSVTYLALENFLVVAGAEEGAKYFVMKRRTWRSPEFNCQFDGVVYAVFVSLGFALLENLNYVAAYGFGTAVVRAVTAVPGHACFGVFMGTWYGSAKRCQALGRRGEAAACRMMALVLPMFLHGSYDFIASADEPLFSLIFVIFVAVMFVVAFILVRTLSRRDRYLDLHGRSEPWSRPPWDPWR